MGFNKVYKSLQELFPQIDARVLRAVAIEHSKDVDSAVVAVVEEIIPFFAERSKTRSSLTVTSVDGTDGEIETDSKVDSGSQLHTNVSEPISSEEIKESDVRLSDDMDSQSELVEKSGFNTCQIEVPEVHEADETTTADNCIENCVETSSEVMPCTSSEVMPCLTMESTQNLNVVVHDSLDLDQNNEELDSCIGHDVGLYKWIAAKLKCTENDQGKSSVDGGNVDGLASVAINGQISSILDSSIQFVAHSETQGSMLENNVEVTLLSDDASKSDVTSKIVGTEFESTSDDTFTQSRQIHMIDALEEIIADARNNKKTLFSAMESIISLMKEVENKEEASELAKEDAVMGGKDILDKTEELNKMLQHKKAANDMHAGEVYGEKAILATELKELQSRVLSLSDERDKSLTVLNEIQQALEVRLAAAENEIKYAEQEKLEKENCARKALAEQELIMEKVVEESKILKQQAEENAKLQEFLLDRGRVVDILQGEIAVICQDASLLKEKFDERVPFSKSVSSSQTSCILASSTSSMKSSQLEQMDPVPSEVLSPETPKIDLISSSDQTVSEDDASKNEDESVDRASKDERKALLDDGWDFFDNDDLEA